MAKREEAKKGPDPTDIYVGGRVKVARVMVCLSQETLGDALGITFQQVQKYEKGTNRISASKLQMIATALDRPVGWFFGDDGKLPKKEGADILLQMLGSPGGVALAQDYIAIKRNNDRHVVANVAHALARAG